MSIMKTLSWLPCLLFGFFACSRFVNGPNPPRFDNRYSVNALLNGAAWFGKAYATKNLYRPSIPCTANRFIVTFETDIPHDRGAYDTKAAITGCMQECLPTQLLSFSSIPLAVGRYDLASLKSCMERSSVGAGYNLLDGGDVTAIEFYGTDGWVQVTKYDSLSKDIEGLFEVTLMSKQGELANFRQGAFKAKLTPY